MRHRVHSFVAAVLLLLGLAGTAWAQDGYKIRSGDTLRIEVLEDASLNRDVLVLPDGTISFPMVGSVLARGRTVGQVMQALTTGLADNFATQPNVYIAVQSLAQRQPVAASGGPSKAPTRDAFAMGEVAKPGKFEITPGTTILQFLAQAGGLTRFAAEDRIELRRTDKLTGQVSVYLFSYSGRAKGPRISGGTKLETGDVVVVPQRRLFE